MVRASQTGGNKPAAAEKKSRKKPIVTPEQAVAPLAEEGVKKARRWHSGTQAKRDARRLQKETGLLLRKKPFERIVRTVLEKIKLPDEEDTLRVKNRCFMLLQDTTERHIVNLLRKCIPATEHGKRKTLMAKDVRLVRNIIEDGDNAFVQPPAAAAPIEAAN